MVARIDVVQGYDERAPGLSRAQTPLVEALNRDGRFQLRRVTFAVHHPRWLLPLAYGPVPARLALDSSHLIHITNSAYAHMVPILRKPAIVTCHDLIGLQAADGAASTCKPHHRIHARAAFAGMLRARFIVCVSRATAQAVLERAPQVAGRLHVVHSGVDPVFQPGPVDPAVLARLGAVQPFVLYVGSEQARKNVTRLVEAVALARCQSPALRLVKVGDHQDPSGRAAFVAALGRTGMADGTVILESLPDSDLVHLYRGAHATVLASTEEGFGFPALEALACGCPVIASDLPALHEITDGAALFVNPHDPHGIAAALLRLTGRAVRHDLRVRGLAVARGFSWQRAAARYAELYLEALGR